MVVLPGDFHTDLLKYDHDEEVADLLDAMCFFETTIT